MEKDEIDEIVQDLKEPFDYGSLEYLEVMEKIKAYREKYRREQVLDKFNKYNKMVYLDER